MADSLRRIRLQPIEVWAVKLADRIANLAPPPPHWTTAKIAAYRAEAQAILEALGDAHEPLATRLASRIADYPPSVPVPGATIPG
jgi:(p)ppGpp synthase/HD superfamily hydrolase